MRVTTIWSCIPPQRNYQEKARLTCSHPQSSLVCIEHWERGKRKKAHQLYTRSERENSGGSPIEMGSACKEAALALDVLVDCPLGLTCLPAPVFL